MCYVIWCILQSDLYELGYVFVQVVISIFMMGRTFFKSEKMVIHTSYDLYV